MINGIAHICLGSTNLDATLRYYVECLGMERHFDFLRDNELVGYYLKAGGSTFIEVFKQDAVTPAQNTPIRHLCLEVDDIDKVIDSLKKFSYKISDKKLGADNSWQAWTSDPDGTAIEFHQYTSTSCQHTKKPCLI